MLSHWIYLPCKSRQLLNLPGFTIGELNLSNISYTDAAVLMVDEGELTKTTKNYVKNKKK